MNLTAAQIAAQWWLKHLTGPIPDDFTDRLAEFILNISPLPWGDIEYAGESLQELAPAAQLTFSTPHVQRINPWVMVAWDVFGGSFDLEDPTGYLAKLTLDKGRLFDTLLDHVQKGSNLGERLRCCRILQALPLTYPADRKILIDLLRDKNQSAVVRYAVAQALLGGAYNNFDWAIEPLAQVIASPETEWACVNSSNN